MTSPENTLTPTPQNSMEPFLTLAHESLGICVQIGKQIKKYVDRYRAALPELEQMDASVSLAYNTSIEFEKSLKHLSLPELEEATKLFDRLSQLFNKITLLLSRYDDGTPTGKLDKLHWSFRGRDAATKIKGEIDNWIRQVFPLVLTCLVRVGVVDALVEQTAVIKRVDENVSALQTTLKDLPGMEAGVEMRAAHAAMILSSSSSGRWKVETSWKPVVIDLSQCLEIPRPELQVEELSVLEGSYSFATVKLKPSEPPEPVLLEHRLFDSDTRSTVKHSSDHVAHIISKVDPGVFNVPKCLGYFEDFAASRYSLILCRQFHVNGVGLVKATQFTLEDAISLLQTQRLSATVGSSRQSLDREQVALLQCLNDLESRTRLAIELIRALSYIHAVDFVHKSFRSANIVLCLDANASTRVVPLIVGFHRARHVSASSDKMETLLWQDIIYRHPERWLQSNNPTFKAEYDDYSLGVVLLEIGLGKLARSIVQKKILVSSSNTAQAVLASSSSETARAATEDKMPNEEVSAQVVKTFLKQANLLQNKQGPTFFSVVKKCLDLGNDLKGAKPGFLTELLEELSSAKY
jgi:Protein kinase domain